MNKPELYQKTVDILLDAYNARKIQVGNPCGCAVGNIVAANYPVKEGIFFWKEPNKNTSIRNYEYLPDWYFMVVDKTIPTKGLTEQEGLAQIASTGYTVKEITAIEKAFEGAYLKKAEGYRQDHNQLFGLTAVLNCLREIHEMNDETSLSNQIRLEKIHEKVYCH